MLENKEIWKDCKGYDGRYQISNLGRVWSVVSQRYLDGTKDRDGYLQVFLTARNGKSKKEFIHRLVALVFLPNPEGLPQVNHIDENKQNNSVENLQWVSIKANANHGTRNNRISKANSKPIYCVELDKIFYGTREAERITGINHSGISRACRGIQLTAGGFHWQFAEGGDA